MPPSVLIPSIVIGFVLVALSTWWAGWARAATVDASGARERFAIDHPEASVREVGVSADGRAALLWLDDGCGLVFAVGDKLATRKLRRPRVTTDAAGLWIESPDFATPRVHLAVDPTVWMERLGA
ncbi:MAG: hypothetical protein H6737_28760 [Alphaproteobacteria bacterium]|nr:hypothetical protein [Alphaproteobacteria bacterium]